MFSMNLWLVLISCFGATSVGDFVVLLKLYILPEDSQSKDSVIWALSVHPCLFPASKPKLKEKRVRLLSYPPKVGGLQLSIKYQAQRVSTCDGNGLVKRIQEGDKGTRKTVRERRGEWNDC